MFPRYRPLVPQIPLSSGHFVILIFLSSSTPFLGSHPGTHLSVVITGIQCVWKCLLSRLLMRLDILVWGTGLGFEPIKNRMVVRVVLTNRPYLLFIFLTVVFYFRHKTGLTVSVKRNR